MGGVGGVGGSGDISNGSGRREERLQREDEARQKLLHLMKVGRVTLIVTRPTPAIPREAHHMALVDWAEEGWVGEVAQVISPAPVSRA